MKKHFRALATCITIVMAALGLAFCLSGCQSSEAYEPPAMEPTVAPPVIAEEGVLRVGVDTSKPPLAGSGSDRIIGLDVDIAAALADTMGLNLTIIDVGADPQGAIDTGTVDIVMGIDSSEASDYTFWMSQTYLPTAIAAFATSPSVGVPQPDSGVKFAAQVSSKSAWSVTNEFGTDALVSTNSLADSFTDLENGTVEYVAADAIIGAYTAHGRDLDVSIVALLSQPSGYCIGVSAANVDLQTAITNALTDIIGGGIINIIEQKWLGAPLNLTDVPLTAAAQAAVQATTDSSQPITDSGAPTTETYIDTQTGEEVQPPADGQAAAEGQDGQAPAEGEGQPAEGQTDGGEGGDQGDQGQTDNGGAAAQ